MALGEQPSSGHGWRHDHCRSALRPHHVRAPGTAAPRVPRAEPVRRGPDDPGGSRPLLCTTVSGSILVLRTVGRKSGLVREAPLGYAVVDGRVAMIAGYGRDAHWFRNALANPTVQIALPGAVFAGTAEELTDGVARREAFRAVMAALGTVGQLTLGDTAQMDDDGVDRLADAFPVLAVTPTALLPGPYDPGGAQPEPQGHLGEG